MVAACSGGGGDDGDGGSSSASEADAPPEDEVVADVVQGDDGAVTFTVTDDECGEVSAPFESASPVERRVLVADADETPPTEVFLSDGRSVQLWVLLDCELQQVVDGEGEPYTFDRGFTGNGTGVGCVDADDDGLLDLVGLLIRSDDGTTAEWSRTIVELDGAVATNGETDTGSFTHPDDDQAIALLGQVTCGERTMERDGVGFDA